MTVIRSFVDTGSDAFRANAAAYALLLDDLRARLLETYAGGPPEARSRHVARGKQMPR
ncbi:MAG: methylcrotonoyl-CoA carboxylase, partial [Chloroflexi bacterium]|nr:methylcrotonoyl-CoA carboxylase [Chloroflexota bacterium]